MQVTINRKQLVSALDRASKVVPKKHHKPAVGCVRLTATDGTLIITGTDLWTTAYLYEEAEVTLPGRAVVTLAALFKGLKAAEGESVTLATDEGGTDFRATTCLEERMRLDTIDPDEYPALDAEVHPVVSFPVRIEQLRRALSVCLPIAPKYQGRYQIDSIALKAGQAIATDRRRLVLVPLGEYAQPEEHAEPFLLPRAAADKLLKLLPKAPRGGWDKQPAGEPVVQVDLGKSSAYFRLGTVDVEIRLQEGEYPRFEAILRDTDEETILIGAAEAAKRLRFASSQSEIGAVRFSTEDKVPVFSTETTRATVKDAEVNGTADGEHFACNADMLAEGLKLSGQETVPMGWFDKGSPIFLRGDAGYTYVLMPITFEG